MWDLWGRGKKSGENVTSYMDCPLEKLARLCTIVSHPLKTKVFSVFTTQISLVISHRADLWSRPMSHFRQQICYWNKKPWQKKRDFYLYLKLCQMGYVFSTKSTRVFRTTNIEHNFRQSNGCKNRNRINYLEEIIFSKRIITLKI